jgi:DNA-binding LacI/PurR family transcriptional regulator
MYLLGSHQFANIAIESLRDTQKNIGKDISVLSFDSNFLESFAPYITTISQPVTEVNKNLINLIIGKLNNMKSNKNFLYKSKLNEKNSVIDLNNI